MHESLNKGIHTSPIDNTTEYLLIQWKRTSFKKVYLNENVFLMTILLMVKILPMDWNNN